MANKEGTFKMKWTHQDNNSLAGNNPKETLEDKVVIKGNNTHLVVESNLGTLNDSIANRAIGKVILRCPRGGIKRDMTKGMNKNESGIHKTNTSRSNLKNTVFKGKGSSNKDITLRTNLIKTKDKDKDLIRPGEEKDQAMKSNNDSMNSTRRTILLTGRIRFKNTTKGKGL